MRNRGSDRNGVFLAGNETRQSQLAKTGKCSRLIHEQKDRIEAALARCQMTISDLASELGLSNDTIRNRINEMVIEGRGVRVAGWRVLERVRVTAIRKRRKAESEHHRALTPAIGPAAVRFRREGMDEWLFRIQELR